MTESKISIYDLRKNVFDNINSNKFVTAKTKTSLLKQYNDALITTDKKGIIYKRTVQSQRTQLNKLNDKLKEFDVKTPTLEKVNIKIKKEKKKEEEEQKAKVVFVKAIKQDVYNVQEYINTPKMLTTILSGGAIIQTSGSFKRDVKNVMDILSKYKGKIVTVDYIVDGAVIEHREYGDDYEYTFFDFLNDSGKTAFFNQNYKGYIKVSQTVLIKKKKVPQYYLDGINHCFLHPINQWAYEKYKEAKNKNTQRVYLAKHNNIKQYLHDYKDGVPDKKDIINEICNKLQINITIDTPMQDNILTCTSESRAVKTFKFINTRLNHVESIEQNFNDVVNIGEVDEVTQETLLDIIEHYDKHKQHYTYKKHKNITSVSTLKKTYKTSGEFYKLKNEFLEENDLINCMVDDIDDKQLSNFIRHGMHYNTLRDLNQGHGDLLHDDMTKAYIAYEKCHLYEGFLGKITDFRKCDKIMGLGYYMIDNLDFSECDEKFKYYNDSLIMYNNKVVYPSPDLKMLDLYGVKYTVVCGCWGVKPIHFTLSDEMINGYELIKTKNGKEQKIRHYAKLFGSLDQHNTTEKIWMKGTQEYFETIMANSSIECRYFDNGEGYFIKKKQHNYHLTHVTGFITAYQRISLIEQLMAMDNTKVVRVCTDGIFYEPHEFKTCNVFVKKDGEKAFKINQSLSYLSGLIPMFKDEYDFLPDNRDNYSISLFKGVGGSGKTHINIGDEGFIKKAYFVTSWKLANEKKKEFPNVYCNVMANLLDSEKMKLIKRNNNVIIIDECSMISNEIKMKILQSYYGCKIIFCGDVGYQLDCIGDGSIFNEEHMKYIKNFTYSHRCKCESLRDISNKLREFIDENKDFESVKKYIYDFFKKKGLTITQGVLKDKYFVGDMILSYRKTKMVEYTNKFKGKFKREKYVVIDNKILGKNRGDIIISNSEFIKKGVDDDGLDFGIIDGYNVVVKHAFTVHSVQGITCTEKLYIDLEDMKDIQMLYTAISRSQYLKNIKLIV